MTTLDRLTSAALACSHQRAFVGGVVQHPQTGKFQLWFLPTGCDIKPLRAYESQAQATASYQTLRRAFSSGNPTRLEEAFAVMSETGENPTPFPVDFLDRLRTGVRQALAARGMMVQTPVPAVQGGEHGVVE
ncbi:MAG: hypothetical protein SNJ67_03345 [Chloracidobacterium sp.]